MIHTREITEPAHIHQGDATRHGPLVSPRFLRRALGGLWLLDGLLQLQPAMFTRTLISQIMEPAVQGQPALMVSVMQPMINLIAHHIVPFNAAIAVIQITLGVCLLRGWFVRPVILASIAWSLAVWCGGEGMGMLLTGQASALTGAPGAVLLYALLGAAAYPRDLTPRPNATGASTGTDPFGGRMQLALAGFWALAAALQIQPYWWQPGQIARAVLAVEGRGTLNGSLLGPSLQWFAGGASNTEIILNIAFIFAALGLATGLTVVRPERARPLLIASMILSVVIWWATQAFGQLLSGAATDVNSGPPLVLLAIACWPVAAQATNARKTTDARTPDQAPHLFATGSQAGSAGLQRGKEPA